MRLNYDIFLAVSIAAVAITLIVLAFYTIPAARRQNKEFQVRCKLHDGIVYRTRDGAICLKQDSVITNL